MRSGELRERLSVQTLTETADTYGAAGTETWATASVVWAAVEPQSGREFFSAERLTGEVTHRIRIRYRDDWTTAITPKHRLLYGARLFDIISVIEVVPRQELQILARERV